MLRLHDDLFHRDISSLENEATLSWVFFADVAEQFFILDHKNAQVDIYVAGFPCKAFSALRAESNWLADAQARQFYKCAETAEVVQPRAFRKQLDLPSIFLIIWAQPWI